MKLRIYVDGCFGLDERLELDGIVRNLVIDWEINTIPAKADYFVLRNFCDNLPNCYNEGIWQVMDREFVDHETVLIGLMYEE